MTELLRHTLREDIQISMQFDAGIWPVEADVAALELALLNLVVNARDVDGERRPDRAVRP